MVSNRKPWNGGIINKTEIYGSSDKEEEADFEGICDVDDDATGSHHFDSSRGHFDGDFTAVDDGNDGDDEHSSEDSDNDSKDSLLHGVWPHRDYRGLELTWKQLQSNWTLARGEWWKPIWEEFFFERDELPIFDAAPYPEEDLLDNPDWMLPRMQLLSFEEIGCPISVYNEHYLYPEEEFVCACESDDDFELLGSSEWEGYNSTAEDEL